uniref:Putative secreted protein n=1 Tax=Ixodes ricinus TaxID=34613 RepID=A0A6B0TVE9_IXORI
MLSLQSFAIVFIEFRHVTFPVQGSLPRNPLWTCTASQIKVNTTLTRFAYFLFIVEMAPCHRAFGSSSKVPRWSK